MTCPGGTCPKDQLQAALNAGGTVYACPGRYRGGTINLPANVTLIGAGDGISVTSDTILDGENLRRVLVPSAATMNVAHVRIAGGRISSGFGAGVYHLGHSMTMTDCTIAGNTNESIDGGGIYNQGNGVTGNSLTLTRCKVEGNNARNGAGIFSITKLNLIACQIRQNTASTNGGGIRVSGGTTTLDACTITGNDAPGGGGGVYSSVVVEVKNGATITGNTPDNCPGAAVPGCTG